MYSTVRVITPATIPVVDVATLRQHIRLDTAADDTLLAMYLATATAWAEAHLGRALLPTTLRWTVAHDVRQMQSLACLYSGYGSLWQPYQFISHRPLELPRAPVQSVSEVRIGVPGDDDLVLDPSLYTVDTASEPARLLLSQRYRDWYRLHNLQVTFLAGYPDADSVPVTIKHAIMLLTAFLYEQRGDAGGEMPQAAKHLLDMNQVAWL